MNWQKHDRRYISSAFYGAALASFWYTMGWLNALISTAFWCGCMVPVVRSWRKP